MVVFQKVKAEQERQLRLKKEQEEREKELLKQKRKIEAKITDNNIIAVLPPIPIEDISYPDPSVETPKPISRPEIPTELKLDIPVIPKAPKPYIAPSAPTIDEIKPSVNKLDIPT